MSHGMYCSSRTCKDFPRKIDSVMLVRAPCPRRTELPRQNTLHLRRPQHRRIRGLPKTLGRLPCINSWQLTSPKKVDILVSCSLHYWTILTAPVQHWVTSYSTTQNLEAVHAPFAFQSSNSVNSQRQCFDEALRRNWMAQRPSPRYLSATKSAAV
jgi:hypothetical protein